MRKPFLLSLLVALLTSLSTHAYDFQSGDLYYNITSDTTVDVTYQEGWSESNYQGLTTATIPATVTYNGTTYSGRRCVLWLLLPHLHHHPQLRNQNWILCVLLCTQCSVQWYRNRFTMGCKKCKWICGGLFCIC